MNKKTREFKVVTIGDSAVGKTCLINRIASDEFYETPATVGSSYMEYSHFKCKNCGQLLNYENFLDHITEQHDCKKIDKEDINVNYMN